MATSDFGGKLRQARERRGVSLRQIAATTKISVAALEALERNDISKLPGGIFSRAFVRSYAIEVGLDPDETVREFLERFGGQTAAAPAPARQVLLAEEESGFDSQQRMAGVVLKLVLISVPLVGVILYLTLRNRPAPQQPANARPQTTQSAPVQPARQPAVASVPPSLATGQPSSPLGAFTLALHPASRCWVKLTVDGKVVLQREMEPGERLVRQIREEAILHVRDAAACSYSINGRPGRQLGEAGDVRTARITPATVNRYVR